MTTLSRTLISLSGASLFALTLAAGPALAGPEDRKSVV